MSARIYRMYHPLIHAKETGTKPLKLCPCLQFDISIKIIVHLLRRKPRLYPGNWHINNLGYQLHRIIHAAQPKSGFSGLFGFTSCFTMSRNLFL